MSIEIQEFGRIWVSISLSIFLLLRQGNEHNNLLASLMIKDVSTDSDYITEFDFRFPVIDGCQVPGQWNFILVKI